jgi:seryl-tRNA synthetase
MATYRGGTAAQEAFRDSLFDRGLLIPSGVPGVYGRGAGFEAVRVGVDRAIDRAAAPDGAEILRFPPLLPRQQLESLGYLKNFPHLAGTIFGFEGSEIDANDQFERASRHEDWSQYQAMSDLVLLPAACYPIYPALAARGPLPTEGATVDGGGAYVFRLEPSGDPARLQMFHQREMVRLGTPETVQAWRDGWRDRAMELLAGLGLVAAADIAADPFFGRQGRMLASSQREQALKFEVLVDIAGDEPTAVASFNYHHDHFTSTFGLTMDDGGIAHTACLGFGLERITLALFCAHGLDATAWPSDVRSELGIA